MAGPEGERQEFGCERCWPPDPEAAWDARGSLGTGFQLIDESHFHVMILGCARCSQRFVSVFTETIDWEDGDDPQFWTVLPITPPEAEGLVQKKDSLAEFDLNALPGRRSLHRDHPKGEPVRVYWGTGIFVGFHD